MGEILNLERSDCSRIGNIILRPLVCCEPAEKSAFKFTMRGGPRHGVTRMWHQPELNMAGCGRGDQLRMVWRNIPSSSPWINTGTVECATAAKGLGCSRLIP
jgi:hypothetical protein